jgi:hypothetical protein
MIDDLKDLKALFKLCRAQGITEFKMNGIEVKFGDIQSSSSTSISDQDIQLDPASPYANFPQGELTPEQLAFYSAGGLPENDPQNQEAV